MTSIDQLLAEYAADHQHPVNRQLHTACVPIIFVSLLGLLAAVPVPEAFNGPPAFVNWAVVALVAALAWYFVKSVTYGAAMLVFSALSLLVISGLERLPVPLAASSGLLFVVGWIGQFIGHRYEGKRPSFFRDLQFLLVGPLWVIDKLINRHGPRD